eukprot:scaffold2626_cov92-Isochrysis_galbana.AAC.1
MGRLGRRLGANGVWGISGPSAPDCLRHNRHHAPRPHRPFSPPFSCRGPAPHLRRGGQDGQPNNSAPHPSGKPCHLGGGHVVKLSEDETRGCSGHQNEKRLNYKRLVGEHGVTHLRRGGSLRNTAAAVSLCNLHMHVHLPKYRARRTLAAARVPLRSQSWSGAEKGTAARAAQRVGLRHPMKAEAWRELTTAIEICARVGA